MTIWRSKPWATGLLLVVVLATVAYGRLWDSRKVPYSPYSDFVAQHLGTKTVLHNALKEGRGLPFWRGDLFSGYPALTSPAAMYTNPLHFLFFFQEPARGYGGTLWIHFVVAAMAMYAMGHVLGLGTWPKLLMAIAGLFNFKLLIAVYAGWLNHLGGIVLFPILFAATFYAAERPGFKAALAVAAAGGLLLHTGLPQYFFYSVLFLAAYVLTQAGVRVWRGRWAALRRFAVVLVCGAILGSGMAAYLWLPVAGEADLLSRRTSSYEFFLSDHSLVIPYLLTFFYPEALGTPLDGSYPNIELWEDVAYFGLIPLLLAIVGVVWGWKRCHTRFLAAAFCASVIVAADTPVLRLLYEHCPGFTLFRCPTRFLFLSAFFGIALAGIGLEELLSRWGRLRRPWPAYTLVMPLLLLMSIEGCYYSRRYLNMAPRDEVVPSSDYQRFLGGDHTKFRVAPFDLQELNYGWAAGMGLELITGYDSYYFSHYRTLFGLLESGKVGPQGSGTRTDVRNISRWDLLDALNVKYVIASRPAAVPGDQFELVARWENQPMFLLYTGFVRRDVFLYRNNRVLPRAFWARTVIETPDERRVNAEMERQPLRDVAVIRGSRTAVSAGVASPADQAEVRSARGGYLSVHTVNESERFLVISEVWHPGWRAFLDGREIPLLQTDLALMGVWVPGGSHQLTLHFRPLYWKLSLVITAISLLVFLSVLAWAGMRRCARVT